MKTYTVLINLKDHVGCYRILGVTVDDHAPRPSINKIYAAWVRAKLESYLRDHPDLWDEECEQLVKDGVADRYELMREIAKDDLEVSYEDEADSFIKHLKKEYGFFETECIEFGFGV